MPAAPRFVTLHFASEVGIKGRNRPYFQGLVRSAVTGGLGASAASQSLVQDRLLVRLAPDASPEGVRDVLSRVLGLSWFAFCESVPADEAQILDALERGLPRPLPASLRVEVVRADKSFPLPSMDAAKKWADALHGRTGVPVTPRGERTAFVDIAGGRAFVFFEKIPGAGGMPAGSAGKIAVLLSGGIDSPVAAWLLARRGAEPVFVHFHPFAEGKERLDKIEALARAVTRYSLRGTLVAVPFTPFLTASLHVPPRFALLVFRRFMLRVAERVAREHGALALATGESLAQVASQTLPNLAAVDAAATLPVLRPLAGLDKTDIIARAKHLGTYDVSIQPYNDCCAAFASRAAATKASPALLARAEAGLDVERLVEETLRSARVTRFAWPEPARAKPVG